MNIDLYEYVRGDRPWAQLYRFLERLPVHGHFHASIMNDEDSVETLRNYTQSEKPKPLDTLGWTAERDLLTTIVEMLAHIHATLIQVHSADHKRPAVEPLRRPGTVLQKIERQQEIKLHKELVGKFIPGR